MTLPQGTADQPGTAPAGNTNGLDQLTTGASDTGETATMTIPGSRKTEDQASQGSRIAGEDNRQ